MGDSVRTKRSLRARLILAATVWISISIALAYWLLAAIFLEQSTGQFDDELDIHVQEIQRLTAENDAGDVFLTSQFSDPRYDAPRTGFYWMIRTGNQISLNSGSFAGLNIDLPAVPASSSDGILMKKTAGPTGTLLYAEITAPTPSGIMRQYIVGTDKRHLDAMVDTFNRQIALSLILIGIILIVFAALLIRQAMAPFNRLRHDLETLRSGKERRLGGTYPSEVEPLVGEFNTLLSAASEMLQRARASAGNLAHGLKAPLTIISSESYEMEQSGDVESANTITSQCQKMQRHIDHHLARTRSSIVARMPGMRTSIMFESEDVLRAMQSLYCDKTVTVTTNIDPDCYVTTDAQDLQEVLGNLLDNAFKYAATTVEVSAARSLNGLASIVVQDDGPGLPTEARKSVFNLGQRWDEKGSGSGLGLTIAKEITDLYGGAIELDDSSAGGLKVRVDLPACD